jgi:hypothetical protein
LAPFDEYSTRRECLAARRTAAIASTQPVSKILQNGRNIYLNTRVMIGYFLADNLTRINSNRIL